MEYVIRFAISLFDLGSVYVLVFIPNKKMKPVSKGMDMGWILPIVCNYMDICQLA